MVNNSAHLPSHAHPSWTFFWLASHVFRLLFVLLHELFPDQNSFFFIKLTVAPQLWDSDNSGIAIVCVQRCSGFCKTVQNMQNNEQKNVEMYQKNISAWVKVSVIQTDRSQTGSWRCSPEQLVLLPVWSSPLLFLNWCQQKTTIIQTSELIDVVIYQLFISSGSGDSIRL